MLCEKSLCTGCGACVNACTTGALIMEPDEKGFLYPRVNKELCKDCGACRSVCPGLFMPRPHERALKVVACRAADGKILEKSSSGGVFRLLAGKISAEGGCVFGAVFDGDFLVMHKKAEDASGVVSMCSTKYVQSDMKKTYSECLEALDAGKKVLFSGTPCEIAGLYGFLGGDRDGLYTCDLVCHGAPSPAFWHGYLKTLSEKYGSYPAALTFKSKRTGWHCASVEIEFENGKVYRNIKDKDPFMRAFLKNYILRESCYGCRFAGGSRQGDLTLGDFWGYRAGLSSFKDDDRGISLVMLNSEKGKKIFSEIKTQTVITEKSFGDALPGNLALKQGVKKPQDHVAFWEELETKGFDSVKKKYLAPAPRAGLDRFLWTPFGMKLRRLLKK